MKWSLSANQDQIPTKKKKKKNFQLGNVILHVFAKLRKWNILSYVNFLNGKCIKKSTPMVSKPKRTLTNNVLQSKYFCWKLFLFSCKTFNSFKTRVNLDLTKKSFFLFSVLQHLQQFKVPFLNFLIRTIR